MKVGIIGCGSMGSMLTDKFYAAGECELFVTTRTLSKLEGLPNDVNVCKTNSEVAAASDMVFLCVRPDVLKNVLDDIKSAVSPDTLIVSLNGSVRFDRIEKVLRTKTAKVIPSVTAEIDRSQTLVCYNDLVTEKDKNRLKDLLSCMGDVIELAEDELGMGSELVSCMPGFIASVFDVMCTSAMEHTSLPKEQVVSMVLNTLTATGELMLKKGMTFGEVVERVATKGGITEVGSSVIYEQFPHTAQELFEKTLEKRAQTAEKCSSLFTDDSIERM